MLTSLFLRLAYVGAEWILWLLVALSIISLALMVERWLYFFRTRGWRRRSGCSAPGRVAPADCKTPGSSSRIATRIALRAPWWPPD